MQRRINNFSIMAALITVAGLILIIYSLVAYQSGVSGYNGHDSMMGSSTSIQYYTITNMFLAIVGALMLASGLLYAFLRQPIESIPTSQIAYVPVAQAAIGQGTAPRPTPRSPSPEAIVPNSLEASAPINTNGLKDVEASPACLSPDGESSLVLRLLSGDERTMFRTIKDAGGETLQRDLVATTKMSEAKVSRVIDKLVEKGLVVKERNGMGNKVRIQIEA